MPQHLVSLIQDTPLLQIFTLIYSLEMLVFTILTYKFLKSGPPCQQLKRRHQSCHSNAISFAPSPKGLKAAQIEHLKLVVV